MQNELNIMIVEDSPAYRKVLERTLGSEPNIQEILKFGTAEIALRSLNTASHIVPDVILLDLSLPGMSGLEALPHFLEYLPGAKIVMLTQSDKEADVIEAIAQGASGYLLKSATAQQIKDAIRAVMAGGSPLDAGVSSYVLNALKLRPPEIKLEKELSKQEQAVLTMLAEGLSRKEIAGQLSISPSTVVTHLNRIYEKLEVHNAPAAISKAYRSGILA